MLEKLFKLSSKKTNVKTEVIAGVTTFLTMAYILGVNPAMLGDAGMPMQSVFLATALSSGIACLVMGLVANYPVALAPGMGVNALFTYTVVLTNGFSWQAALAAVFVSGVIFLIISITGLRKFILELIPRNLRIAIGAGIGFFIAFVGLQNAGIVVPSVATGVSVGDMHDPAVLLALFGIVVTLTLVIKKVKAGIFYGLVLTAIVGVVLSMLGVTNMPVFTGVVSADFDFSTFGAFTQGFGELFSNPSTAFVVVFSFLFVDFFDTAGTLLAVAHETDIMDKKTGELKDVEKALLADSIGTVIGAAAGTSTVTAYIESTSGIEVGGRTGLTAVVAGLLFFVAVLFSPLLSMVTSSVTTSALVVVGILMAKQLKEIDWDDMVSAASGFITIIMMVVAYSISDGIAFGFITYALASVASGKGGKIRLAIWLLVAIFILYFAISK
ncbi:MAG: NCS2 family permease [Erysipelotrichaceae bacterium]